jgi:beta-RFAP synthase
VPAHAEVAVHAPGRLHLGFLDPAGSLGRRYGSLGLVVEGFETIVEVGASSTNDVISGDRDAVREVERAAEHLDRLQRWTGLTRPLRLGLVRVLPAHTGLGSGTQLALAIGRAFAQWHRLDIDTPQLAQRLGRGVRSGIGIAGFDHGGLLLDGGPGADGAPAPLLARFALPAAWRVLVVQDHAHRGLAGADERRALAALAPLPRTQAAEICHEMLMRVLPGAADADLAPFASGICRVQRILGEHFAPAQGGGIYTSAAVGRVLEWIGAESARGAGPAAAIGQSSWGPTGFAIVASQEQADALLDAARAAGVVGPSLAVRIVAARNRGAVVEDRRSPVRSSVDRSA